MMKWVLLSILVVWLATVSCIKVYYDAKARYEVKVMTNRPPEGQYYQAIDPGHGAVCFIPTASSSGEVKE